MNKEKKIFDEYGNYDFPTDIKQKGLNMATSQIDEMGTIIATVAFVQAHKENGDENLADIVATELYNVGYRKINPKEQFVVTKDEISDIIEQAKKESAREILQTLYDKCYEDNPRLPDGIIGHIIPIDILVLAEHYGVEVEE